MLHLFIDFGMIVLFLLGSLLLMFNYFWKYMTVLIDYFFEIKLFYCTAMYNDIHSAEKVWT